MDRLPCWRTVGPGYYPTQGCMPSREGISEWRLCHATSMKWLVVIHMKICKSSNNSSKNLISAFLPTSIGGNLRPSVVTKQSSNMQIIWTSVTQNMNKNKFRGLPTNFTYVLQFSLIWIVVCMVLHDVIGVHMILNVLFSPWKGSAPHNSQLVDFRPP